MILRSGKLKIKSSKQEDDDIISKLPDELLTRILSMLPDSDAVRTRILSNRWKDLWAFLPNLHFVMPIEQSNKFHDSVDQTLAIRDGMPIQRFFLQCSDDCDVNRLCNWLHIVDQCKVKQLEIRFPTFNYNYSPKLIWDLFKTCNTLVELTLNFVIILAMPEAEWHLPCLKKMKLVWIRYSGEQSVVNLTSGCPVLEELCLDGWHMPHKWGTVKIISPSLKRLSMTEFGGCKFVVDAPNLKYLHIVYDCDSKYSFTHFVSIAEAHISNGFSNSLVQLMTCVSSAKILTLTSESVGALGRSLGFNLLLPVFSNLVKLVITWGGNLIPVLLNSMPILEHITFSNGLLPHRMAWNPPMEEAPACLRFKMKEIIILSLEVVKSKQVDLLRYLLKHSNILEKLTIDGSNIDRERRRQLLNIRRRSNSCQIEFV